MWQRAITGSSGGSPNVFGKEYTQSLSNGTNTYTFSDFEKVVAICDKQYAWSGFLDADGNTQSVGTFTSYIQVLNISGNQISLQVVSGYGGNHGLVVIGY